MTPPRRLRVALVIAYLCGIVLVVAFIEQCGPDVIHRVDRQFCGVALLVVAMPFTVIGAVLMRPYIRRPEIGWWFAYHVALMFVVIAYVGFFFAVGLGGLEFLWVSLVYEFPAKFLGLETPAALIVASAPLIKRHRERRAPAV